MGDHHRAAAPAGPPPTLTQTDPRPDPVRSSCALLCPPGAVPVPTPYRDPRTFPDDVARDHSARDHAAAPQRTQTP